MNTMGPYHFTVTERQVVSAMQRQMLSRLLNGVTRWMLILIAVLMALLIAFDLYLAGTLSGTTIAFVIAAPIALGIIHFWMAPMLGRRQYRQSAALRAESTIAWDEEAVTFSAERGHARLPFAEFHGFASTNEMLLLYQTEMFFNIVPMAALGDAAGDLVAKLEEAGVKRV